MPLYEYKCSCGFIEEILVLSSKSDIPPCPQCGSINRQRLLNPVAAIYKCGGFYTTDYKNKPEDKKDKKDK